MSIWGGVPSKRDLRIAAAEQPRIDALTAHVRNHGGPFNIDTLARSYALPADRVARILASAGVRDG